MKLSRELPHHITTTFITISYLSKDLRPVVDKINVVTLHYKLSITTNLVDSRALTLVKGTFL